MVSKHELMLKQKKKLKLNSKAILQGKYNFYLTQKYFNYNVLQSKKKKKNNFFFFKKASSKKFLKKSVSCYKNQYTKYINIFLKDNIKKKKFKIIKKYKCLYFFITMRFAANNAFLTISIKKPNGLVKLLFAKSAGYYKLKVSKKISKFNQLLILKKYLKEIKKVIRKHKKKNQKFIIFLKAFLPLKLRQKAVNFINNVYKTQVEMLLYKFLEKKAFNGCRPKKKKRKKRKGLRIFK